MAFDFKKLFHKGSKKKKNFKLVTFDAMRDWKRLFFFFLTLLFLALAWGSFIFWQIQSGKLFSEKEVVLPEVPLPDTSNMKTIKERHAEKAKLFEMYSTSRPETVDPNR